MTSFSIHLNEDEQKEIKEKLEMTSDEKLTNKIIKTALISQQTEPTLKSKIEYQKYLKLCLENWNLIKSTRTQKDAQEIILGIKELESPQLQNQFSNSPVFEKTQAEGLNEMGYCGDCLHFHYGDSPRKCKQSFCNCGVRG